MRIQPKIFLLGPMVIFFGLTYLILFLLDKETLIYLGKEDGFFEYMTAISFFFSSVFFFMKYLKSKSGNNFFLFRTKKNIVFLILAGILFFGAGEEISWGQRILKIKTPEIIKKHNVQNEISIHNLKIFQNEGSGGKKKPGLVRYLMPGSLFRLFSFAFFILIPLLIKISSWVNNLLNEINFPVPPPMITIFFLLNWIVFKIANLTLTRSDFLAWIFSEIRESSVAFLFLMASIYFLRDIKLPSVQ